MTWFVAVLITETDTLHATYSFDPSGLRMQDVGSDPTFIVLMMALVDALMAETVFAPKLVTYKTSVF